MSPTLEPVHLLAGALRRHGSALLGGMPEPHDELMSLVWGPRFDREHALGLIARRPAVALPALPALLAAADAFDALHGPAQQRLRQLIRRHRALSMGAPAGRVIPCDTGASWASSAVVSHASPHRSIRSAEPVPCATACCVGESVTAFGLPM